MKIRMRLTLIFSIIIVITLSAFGLITYKTFSDSIVENKNQIYIYKINDIFAKLHADIIGCIDDIDAFSAQSNILETISGDSKTEKTKLQKVLSKYLRTNELISSIYLVAPDGSEILKIGRKITGKKAINHSKLQMIASKRYSQEPFILEETGKISIVYPVLVKKLHNYTYILVYEINLKKIRKTILPSMQDGEALFITLQNGALLLDVRNSKEKQLESLSIKSIIRNTKKYNNSRSTTFEYKNYYIFSSTVESGQWNLTYAVPKGVYLSDLIILKNRIAVAIVVMIWLSVWTVLIVSYRISKPLMFLSKATKDMMAFNYETPITIPRTKDEIEDLASSFESMRLKMKDLVLKDPLTDTYNRRYLIQFLEHEVAKASRLGNQLSVLMIDIDHFKTINDTCGHYYGDTVLQAVAQSLTQMVREYDIVARYGGEEFIVVLPNISSKEAHLTAERLRKEVEINKLINSEVKVTISIGLSTYDKNICNTPEKLINTADVALYQAKEAGRNRTIVYKIQKAV